MKIIKTDRQILTEVVRKYVLGVPVIRALIMPTFAVMIFAKFLEVRVADIYKDISTAIQTGTNVNRILVLYSVIFIGSIVLGEMQSIFICRAGQAGYRLANQQTYKHYIDLEPSVYQSYCKGEIQNKISRKAQAVQDIIDVFTLNFFPTFITVIFISYKVIFNIGFVSVVIINIAIIVYTIVTIKITKWRNGIRAKINNSSNLASNILVDGLINHETIYIHNNQSYEAERYNKSLKCVEKNSASLERSKYLLNMAQRGIWCVLSIVIITIAAKGILVDKMDSNQLAFFISVVGILVKSLDNFGFMYGKYQQALINIRQVEFLEERIRKENGHAIFNLSDSISVNGLTLHSRDKLLMRDINFKIFKGEKVAIVGKNGVGKSSLLKAMLRLRPATEGSIFVDNINVNDINDNSFKNLVSYVSQDTHLFNETVIYNIKYGAPKAFDEDIYRLSRKIGLHDSILRLEHGYYTTVGEQGNALSGGERQKVIILRALLKESPILVMDEPTAALDKQAEAMVIGQLMKYEELTIVAIVHNLELLKLFNKVLLVEQTGVTEIKTADDIFLDKVVTTS